jgi:molybdopterin molybdotransferase
MHMVRVRELPRAVVISTGDELVEVFAHPLPHQIRRSNVHAITAALMQSGIAVVDQRHINDTQAELAFQLNEVLHAYDLVILSGGVSMGKLDFVPDVLKECGVEIHFHGIAQRPGKPMLFGTTERARVFALPGNPVSSLVCWARYVKPFLEQGVEPIWINQAFEMNAGKLTRFVPVAQNNGRMDVLQINGSGDFMSLAGIFGFVEVRPGEQQMPIALWPL